MRSTALVSCVTLVSMVPPTGALASVYTLSDQDLLKLDRHAGGYTARVVDVRDVPGPGVEFDIHYPSTSSPGNGLHYISGQLGGAGVLAAIKEHDTCALTFTLVAVDGAREAPVGGHLVVGAIVSDRQGSYRYRPETVSLSAGDRTATSMTDVGARGVGELGIETHFLGDAKGWSAPVTLTLLVQPTPGARPLQELARKATAPSRRPAAAPAPAPAPADRPGSAAPTPGRSPNVTLSDRGLLSLDWQDGNDGAQVVDIRDVPGPGVEFDVRFPSQPHHGQGLSYMSGRYGGAGKLAGLDLSSYANFALRFTLVAVNGVRDRRAGDTLVVGAVVYDPANRSRYRPTSVSLADNWQRSATSTTKLTAQRIDGLGFRVHALVPAAWEPGTIVTLLVAPAADALELPEQLETTSTVPNPSPRLAPVPPGPTLWPAMTYREWLVGMALASGRSGAEAVAEADEALRRLHPPGRR